MKNKQFLINLLVVLALLGYVASSIYIFNKAFLLPDARGQLPREYSEALNPALVHILNGLTGLVGGIVASAFGTKWSESPDSGPGSIHYRNFRRLGNLVYSSPEGPPSGGPGTAKARYGFVYALAYILVGLTALAIWVILGEGTLPVVSATATTFLGMMVPIVATYFKR